MMSGSLFGVGDSPLDALELEHALPPSSVAAISTASLTPKKVPRFMLASIFLGLRREEK
jgi:hypothetical protein